MEGRRAAIWALAVSQTLGYACLYYIFAALVLQWNADLGWPKTTLALGPTLAIVISGTLAPFLGRRVDRGQSRMLLTAGPLVGGVGLVVLALTQTQAQYLAAWALIGAAQAMALYEVCFAFLIRRLGPDARAAIIRVTLVAGFASTLAFPAAALMAQAWGWRGAVWVAAAVVIMVQLPLNYWAAGVIRKGQIVQSKAEDDEDKAALRQGLRSLRFWVLGGLTALLALNHWMMIALIIPVFTDLGVTVTVAVLAASLVGPAQVLGRLSLMRLDAVMG
ncbi:MAG: MFS transporter, partial [Octadecabacter sp.]|nr:MFS transporter [Octadecabacter sp.]